MRQVAKIVFWVILTLAALWLLWAFRGAFVLLLLSIVVASAVRPLVDALHERGVSFKLAIALAYGVCLGTIGLLGYVLATRLLVEIPAAADHFVESYGHHFERAIHEFRATAVAQRALGSTFAALDLIGRVTLVIVLSIYWTGGGDAFDRLWLSFLPLERRRAARAVWFATRRAVGGVLRSELGLSIAAAVPLSVGFWLAQCELWALGTVAVLLLRFIPLIGSPLAVAAAALAASPSGVLTTIIATAIAIAVLAALRTVVAPRFFSLERPLDPTLDVLVILALAGSFGLAGLIAAPLVVAAIQTAYAEITGIQDSEDRVPRMEDLVGRAARLERRLTWSSPSPAVASLFARLQQLLDRAATSR
jgi:predicted PurR-regulated permease PerM